MVNEAIKAANAKMNLVGRSFCIEIEFFNLGLDPKISSIQKYLNSDRKRAKSDIC